MVIVRKLYGTFTWNVIATNFEAELTLFAQKCIDTGFTISFVDSVLTHFNEFSTEHFTPDYKKTGHF